MANGTVSIGELEQRYIDAKVAYYKGNPIMTDASFDLLEEELKEKGSSIINMVGFWDRKAKYKHFSPMTSLQKIQADKATGEPPTDDFITWLNKVWQLSKDSQITLEISQKLDGNAVNLIYEKGCIRYALSRGNGTLGRNYLSKLSKEHIPYIIPNKADRVEIRCEAVIARKTFDMFHADQKNERNYVAGVLNKDESSIEEMSEIDLVPVEYREILGDGTIVYHDFKELEPFGFSHFQDLHISYLTVSNPIDTIVYGSFENLFNEYKERRESPDCKYRWDGLVFKVESKYRSQIGETDHHPKWAIAVKFKPEDSTTVVAGVTLKMGKTGEFTPIVLLDPVDLDGSVVSKASGYNYKWMKDNKIGEGAIIKLVKSGDIIPQITSVEAPSEEPFDLLTECPYCHTKLVVEGEIHLICPNEDCTGKEMTKFIDRMNCLELDGIGDAFLSELYTNVSPNPFFYIKMSAHGELTREWMVSQGMKDGKVLDQFSSEMAKKTKEGLTIEQVIYLLGYPGMTYKGKTIKQIANMVSGIDYSFANLEREVVDGWEEGGKKREILEERIKGMGTYGVKVIMNEEKQGKQLKLCLTGSPKAFGFSTKKEYVEMLEKKGFSVSETPVKEADYLVTDSLTSKSSKMKTAEKLGKKIITYGSDIEQDS